MALKIGDNVLRNIQEQVEKNKNDIAAWTTLDAFGIKVLGIVRSQDRMGGIGTAIRKRCAT